MNIQLNSPTCQFIRIIKVGGSLFDLPDLRERLFNWLRAQIPARNTLVAGGGKLVDELHLDAVRYSLSEREAHWEAVSCMSATAKWLSQQVLGVHSTSNVDYYAFPNSPPVVFSPETWLREVEPGLDGTKLPESWDVTSDSIAARLAICMGADELVLLKSADPPSSDLAQLAAIGYVDRFFPKLAGELPPWRVVNFRRILFPDQSSQCS